MEQDDDRGTEYPECLLVCPDFVLSTLSLTVTTLIEQALAPLNLRAKHYRLLRLLHFDGPRPQSTIGAALGVDRTTVVAIVDYLERLKLAKRVRSHADRRAYQIALTPKGERLAVKATELVNAAEENMFAPLTPQERSVVRNLSLRLLSEPGSIADVHAKSLNAGD